MDSLLLDEAVILCLPPAQGLLTLAPLLLLTLSPLWSTSSPWTSSYLWPSSYSYLSSPYPPHPTALPHLPPPILPSTALLLLSPPSHSSPLPPSPLPSPPAPPSSPLPIVLQVPQSPSTPSPLPQPTLLILPFPMSSSSCSWSSPTPGPLPHSYPGCVPHCYLQIRSCPMHTGTKSLHGHCRLTCLCVLQAHNRSLYSCASCSLPSFPRP